MTLCLDTLSSAAHNKAFMKKKLSLLLILLSAGVLLLAGCLPGATTGFGCGGAPPSGWSGPVVANDTLYVGSMTGRLVALEDIFSPRARTKWQYPPGDEGDLGYVYGTPYYEDGVVYVAAYKGKVYALDAENGWRMWAYPEDGTIGAIVGGPVVSEGVLYVGSSDGNLYAVNATTGREEWPPFQTGEDIWATPAVHDGVVYIGSFDQKLYAISAQNGVPVWSSPFMTGGSIASAPLVYNDTLYFGSFDRTFYALNLDGTQKWTFDEAGNWFWGEPVAYDGTVIIGSLDGRVYALDAETGQEEWHYPAEEVVGPVRGHPAVAGGVVVFGSEDGTVYAVDAATGAKAWQRDLENPVRAPVCAGEDVVYIHASNQKVYALETEFGGTVWSFYTGD